MAVGVNFCLFLLALELAKANGDPVCCYSKRADVLQTSDGRVRGVRLREDVDFVLGGLFPVHTRGDEGAVCGMIRRERGVERVEAMLYAIDRINSDSSLLPDIKLGFDIRDTCESESIGLDESVEFAIVNREYPVATCDRQSSLETEVGSGNATANTSAVIGAAASAVTVPVATLLRLFQLPQVSYASSTVTLSNRERYGYFFRTVLADNHQARAMIDLVLRFNWTYVSTLYADDFYGNPGISEFQSLASEQGICVDVDQGLDVSFSDMDFQRVASKLLNSSANVVILFASQDLAGRLFEALNRATQQGHQRRFLWIASDAWAHSTEVVSPFNESLAGLFGTVPLTTFDAGFHEYFSRLTLNSNLRDPWFTEFFEAVFSCNATSNCSRNQPITDRSGYRQGNFIPLVIDAVYAVAHALNNFLNENCNQPLVWFRNNHTCEGQKRELNGSALLEYIQRVNFTSPTGNMVEFDSNGNVEGRYEILNYQQKMQADGKVMYEFVTVGQWDGMAANRLNLTSDELQFGLNRDGPLLRPPESQCTLCGPGRFSRTVEGSCCGICDSCIGGNFSNNTSNQQCLMCEEFTWGNNPLSGSNSCVALEETYLKYDNPWGILLMVIASIGLVMVLAVVIVMGIFWNTPIMKASGREHMTMLLLGIVFSFLLTFVFMSRPSLSTCIIQSSGHWLTFALILGSLLVKLIQIARLFLQVEVKRPRCSSPAWQVFFILLTVLVQVLLVVIGLAVRPPDVQHTLVQDPDVFLDFPTVALTCRFLSIAPFVLILIYHSVLVIACNVLAVLTIRFPRNFNEVRYVASCSVTLGLIWISFIPTYLATRNDVRTGVTALTLNLSAFAVLLCIFGPRVFIVIFLPDKNTAEYSVNTKKRAAPTLELSLQLTTPPASESQT